VYYMTLKYAMSTRAE